MTEMLQLCHKVKPGMQYLGWYASEKLDGMRAYWEPSSRGLMKKDVPWANLVKDTASEKEMLCTGLWSRLGNVIWAPDWWLDRLPNISLDGELWMGYEHRQTLMTCIKGHNPCFNALDKDLVMVPVRYHVYDSVPLATMMSVRTCSAGTYKWQVRPSGKVSGPGWHLGADPWTTRMARVHDAIIEQQLAISIEQVDNIVHLHMGSRLPTNSIEHDAVVDDMLAKVIAAGGEGLVLRNPISTYVCDRSKTLLKLKPRDDATGTVIGLVDGLGKHAGRIGSLTVRLVDSDGGKVVNVGGLTDEERERNDWIGKVVSIKYRGKTMDGIPMEAVYHRTETVI